MKKISVIISIMMFVSSLFAEGTFMNKFGGCADDDGTNFGADLFTVKKDGKTEMTFADKADLSFNIDMFSGSVMLSVNDKVFKSANNNVKLEGYGQFSPIKEISIVAGNKTKGKFAVDAARLYTTTGVKLLQMNIIPNGAGLYVDDDIDDWKMKGGLGITTDEECNFFIGLEASYSDAIFIGMTGQTYLNEDYYLHLTGSLGFHIRDLILTFGYFYNYNNLRTGYLLKNDITSKQPFLPAPASHVFKLSGQYKVFGFTFAADCMVGSKSYFVPKSLEDDADVTGNHETLKVFGAALIGYQFEKPVSVNLKYSIWYLDGAWHSIYPYAEFKSGKSSFRAGVRVGIDKEGEVTVSVPLMWTIMFGF